MTTVPSSMCIVRVVGTLNDILNELSLNFKKK